MSFKEIIGQERPLSILKNSLKSDRIAHAYLFIGEDGLGKSLTARNLAKVLNCEREQLDACDRCSACQKIDRHLYPDVKWLEPDGVSQTIKIEPILDLQREIYLKPFEGRKKVFILLEAERMNREAANAFLKTLEEPPGESILILITSSLDRLLPTVKSRCQLIRFTPIPQRTIEEFLCKNLNCAAEEAKNLSFASEGRLGEAVRLKKEKGFRDKEKLLDLILDEKAEVLDTVEKIVKIWDENKKNLELKYAKDLKFQVREEGLNKNLQKILEERKKALLGREYRRAIEKGIETIMYFFRDCLVWKKTEEETLVANQSRFNQVKAVAQESSCRELKEKILSLKEAKKNIACNAHLRLALTVMLLNL